jgi:hypothetical protein
MYKLAILIVIVILILWIGSPLLWFGAGYVTCLLVNDTHKITGGGGTNCSPKAFLKEFNAAPSGFKHEYMVREMFNCFISQGKFEEVDGNTLKWLLAEDGTPLSLDGYNQELGVAFEYQGRGHYEDVFNDHPRYLAQRKNDDTKIRLCKENGVELIIIHYLIEMDVLGDYIKSRLQDLGILKPHFAISVEQYRPLVAEPPRSENVLIESKCN